MCMDSRAVIYEDVPYKFGDFTKPGSNPKFLTDFITQCLTTECLGCTGSYQNSLLRHTFVCKCECHSVTKEAGGPSEERVSEVWERRSTE
jgi:hypothetical protein